MLTFNLRTAEDLVKHGDEASSSMDSKLIIVEPYAFLHGK
jgi:hypothetical protein